jgi:V8-like Glu-specific endopeptidase
MLDPWEEQLADAAIIGPIDARIQEINTTRYPWNTVVHLCRDFGGGGCSGCSGVLIDQRRVLTAAHCIWSMGRQAAPQRILVIPGRVDRKTMPYGARESREFWIPRGFMRGPDKTSWDWGLIVLSRPFERLRRFPPLRPRSDSQLREIAENSRITVAGYPSDRPIGTMWRHAERLVRTTHRRLFHTVDTCPGHSGSPIFAPVNGERAVIGVHTAGILDAEGRSYGCKRGAVLAPLESVNSGTRLLPSIVAALDNPSVPREGPAEMVRLP